MATDGAARARIWTLIRDIRFAMVVARDSLGGMSARPMACVNRDYADELWFMTAAASPRLTEIRAAREILVAYSDPATRSYVSARGTARIVEDRAEVRRFWTEAMRELFPCGPDGALALVAIDVESIEYWDRTAARMVRADDFAPAPHLRLAHSESAATL